MGRATSAILLGSILALAGGWIALAGSTTPNDGDQSISKAGPLRYSSESRLADSGEAQAGCGPLSRRLIGGGGAVSGIAADSYLKAQSPRDMNIEPPAPDPDPDSHPDDGWGANGVGPPGAAVTSTAICRKGGAIKYRLKQIQPNANDQAAGKVGCGGKRWHVTTGTPFVGTAGGWINSSHPYDGGDRGKAPDDGWKIRAYVPAGFPISVYAICARKVKLAYKRAKPVTLGTSQPGPSRTRTRSTGCGKGHAIGGGAKVSGFVNRGRLIATAPVDTGDPGKAPDDRWRVQAHNLGGEPTKLKAFGICWR